MNRFKRLFLRRGMYHELSAEIRERLEEKTEELVAEGMPKKEAETAARRDFGNVTLLEECGIPSASAQVLLFLVWWTQ